MDNEESEELAKNDEGLAVYGITVAILLVILGISFLLAYYLKWEKLMKMIDFQKNKVGNEKIQLRRSNSTKAT